MVEPVTHLEKTIAGEVEPVTHLEKVIAEHSGGSGDSYTKAETDALLNNKQNALVVGTNLDDVPTEDSTNPITSGGVYNTVGNLDSALDSLIMSLEPKTISENGTYDPADDGVDGYSEVTVNVPNTYTAGDNGKVVSNQQLVSQTAYPTTVTENDTYDTTNYNSITVNVSGGGGGSSVPDVVFYDYDGSVVASYSIADFANLSAMPANPTHTGLTAQGWNWSLADAKAYVAANGKLNIGQMYITSDSKTRLYYVIPKDNLTLEVYLTLDEDTELDVDWGDGSGHTTWTSNDGDSSKTHTYSDGGSYTVAITVASGGFSCQSSGDEDYTLKKVEFGSSVTSIEYHAFYYCCALSSVTIPDSVTSIGDNAFEYCYALSSITIPSSVTSIGSAFTDCYALSFITIPDSITSINGGAFSDCYALSSITIPDSVTSISSNAFYRCTSLSSITIPSSVTSIGSAFTDCYALSSITFESSNPPDIDSYIDIPYTCIIRVPQGSLSAYTSESGYPDPEYFTYEEY